MVNNNKINYFLPGPNHDNDKRMSAEVTKQLQRDFEDDLSGIGYFDGTFSLQVKPDSKPHITTKMCSLCMTKPFQEELEWLQ